MELEKLPPSLRTLNSTLTFTVPENETGPSRTHRMDVAGLVKDRVVGQEAGGRDMYQGVPCILFVAVLELH